MGKERDDSEERNRRRARKKKRAEKRGNEEEKSMESEKTEKKRHKKSKKNKDKRNVSSGLKRTENVGTSLPSIKSIRKKTGTADQAESSRKVLPFSAMEKEILITEYLRNREVLMNRGEHYFFFQLYMY